MPNQAHSLARYLRGENSARPTQVLGAGVAGAVLHDTFGGQRKHLNPNDMRGQAHNRPTFAPKVPERARIAAMTMCRVH